MLADPCLVAQAKWANQIERGQFLSVDGYSWQQRPARLWGSCHGYMVGLIGMSAVNKLCALEENHCEHELSTAAELKFNLQSNAGHGGAVQTGARSSNPLIPCSPSCTRNASLKSRPNQSKRRQCTACDISFPVRPMRIDVGCCKDLQGAQNYPHPSNQGKTCKRGFQTTQ